MAINNVVLTGRLVRDPELRYTSTESIPVCNFTLAVDKFKQDEADFINCVAWRKTAELVKQYLQKGSAAGVTGSLRIESYQDQEGKKRTAAKVVAQHVEFLSGLQKRPADDEGVSTEISDEDVPF